MVISTELMGWPLPRRVGQSGFVIGLIVILGVVGFLVLLYFLSKLNQWAWSSVVTALPPTSITSVTFAQLPPNGGFTVGDAEILVGVTATIIVVIVIGTLYLFWKDRQ